MTRPCVAIVGASGHVGRVAAAALADYGDLRLGSRAPERLQSLSAVCASAGATVTTQYVDLDDPASLDHFVAGADVVLNCAGPSYRILDQIALVAQQHQAAYVDVGGDDVLYERLIKQPAGQTVAVVSAGMLPGLSGLLPRYLADQFEHIEQMTCYAGGREAFSPAAAEDFWLSLDPQYDFGTVQAYWRHGQIAPSRDAMDLPDRPWTREPRLLAWPYLSREAQRLFQQLDVEQGWAMNLMEEGYLFQALQRLQGRGDVKAEEAMTALIQASQLDVAGRPAYQVLAVEASGWAKGGPLQRSLWVQVSQGFHLTGHMAAQTVRALPELDDGVHFAAQVLNPQACLQGLVQAWPDFRIQQHEGAWATVNVEEGAL